MTYTPVRSVTFYKTSLDPNYNNVMHCKNMDSQVYKEYLDKIFTPSKIVSVPVGQRYFKATNGKVNIALPISYTDLQTYGYNYVAISGDAYLEFYFIKGFTSLNLGDSPMTNISLEYDAWANSTIGANYGSMCKLVRGTINSYFINNNKAYVDNNFGAKEIKTVYTINPFNKNPSPSQEDPLFAEPKLLWAKLTLDSDEIYCRSTLDTDYAKVTNPGVFQSVSQLPVVYYPVAVFTPDGLNLESGRAQPYSIKGYRGRSIELSVPIRNFDFKIDGLHVVDASLTFYPPFIVDYENYIFTVYNRFEFAYLAYKNNDEYIPPMQVGSGSDNTNYVSVAVYAKEKDYSIDWEQSLTYANKIYVGRVSRYFKGTMNTEDIISSSTVLKVPYNSYLTLKVTGTDYHVIPPANCLYYKILIKHLEDSAYIYVAYYNRNDTIILKSNYIKIDEIGTLPIVADSASVYMRNNGNSISAKTNEITTKGYTRALTALPQGISAIASGNVLGIANAVGSLATTAIDTKLALDSIDAKMKDVTNQRDTIVAVDINAISNVFRNQVLIYKVTPDINDNSVIKAAYDEHWQGVVCSKYVEFNKKYKKHFDYKQFEQIEIANIGTYEERNKLENAFNRGVTIWYAEDLYKDGLYPLFRILNKDMANEVET